LCDFDIVDVTNLQRQILHNNDDVGHRKLDSAATKLKALNPHLNLLNLRDQADQRKRTGAVCAVRYVATGRITFRRAIW